MAVKGDHMPLGGRTHEQSEKNKEKLNHYLGVLSNDPNFVVSPTMSMPDPAHPGKRLNTAPNPLFNYIMGRLRTLTNCPPTMFPGSQPVSMTRENLRSKILSPQHDYIAFEKSDGIRFLVYVTAIQNLRSAGMMVALDLTTNGKRRDPSLFITACPDCLSFAIPRNVEKEGMLIVPLMWPALTDPVQRLEDGRSALSEALFDGELIMSDKSITPRFAIFDLMAAAGESYCLQPLPVRMLAARSFVMPSFDAQLKNLLSQMNSRKPGGVSSSSDRQRAIKTTLSYSWRVQLKTQYSYNELRELWYYLIPSMDHGNDGIVFTPTDEPYTVGSCPTLIKWKPADLNSIDFALSRETLIGTLGEQTEPRPFTTWKLQLQDDSVIQGTSYPFDPQQSPILCQWLEKRGIQVNPQFAGDDSFGTTKDGVPIRYLIVECVRDTQSHGHIYTKVSGGRMPVFKLEELSEVWKVIGTRPDKLLPNYKKVGENVLASISQNIQIDELLLACELKSQSSMSVSRSQRKPAAGTYMRDSAEFSGVFHDSYFDTQKLGTLVQQCL